ncbi:NINE protein [Schlesneria sp. DSM 10557]|uniref:NINE protein n=1 Tax=Schlesneria sp. DSM 10557 TaxID=3044399 RepID=UPI0035A01B63
MNAAGNFCFACGAPADARAEICPKCGVRQKTKAGKSRVTAALLAFLLGGIGAHHFYLGNIVVGILYLLFCWTLIPGIIALVEGILFLTMSDSNFDSRYNS